MLSNACKSLYKYVLQNSPFIPVSLMWWLVRGGDVELVGVVVWWRLMGDGGSWERSLVMSDPPTTPPPPLTPPLLPPPPPPPPPEPEVGVSSWLALPEPEGDGSEGDATSERESLFEWWTWNVNKIKRRKSDFEFTCITCLLTIQSVNNYE